MKIDIAEIQQAYPNNGFGSYWKLLSKRSPFPSKLWKNINTGYKLTALVLHDAAIELFFLFIFWVIITKMSQGRDLIVSLFEPDGIYNQGRIFYTVLSAISLSVSMWIIPAFLFQVRDNKNRNQPTYRTVFKKHLFFVHRVLPMIPFWLLASALFNQRGMTWLFIGLSLLQLILIYWFNKKIKTRETRIKFATGVLLLLVAAIIWFMFKYHVAYTTTKIAVCVILYLIAFLLHFIFHEVDMEILKEHKEPGGENIRPVRKYWINSLFYIALLIVHIGLFTLFFSDSKVQLAPESIMLYIFSLYVFFIDLFVYFINLSQRRKFIATFCVIVIALVYVYSKSLNLNLRHFTLDTIKDSSVLQGQQRLTFEERYLDLKKQIDSNKSGERYPIILVSGEGGGSRAAVWLSQNLINFDYYTRGKFRQHIFSISTVSGSSVGLGSLFTFWELSDRNNIDTGWLELPLKVYSNNFVGSSVRGLLLTDLLKTFIPFVHWEKDRNSILQDEESYYTQKAAREIIERTDHSNPKIPEDKRILCRDFMNFFYRREGDSLRFKDRPLVFINSCRSNDGRRGIISPVKLTDDVFNDAIDMAGYLYEDSVCNYMNKRLCLSHKRNISFEEACNMSELFPLFSAPAYIDSLGSFVDGGYHENSGLKTTLDVYLKLKKALDIDGLQNKYTIYILYFKNGSGLKELYKPVNSELPLALPLKALSSQPFEGSESYFEEKARFTADNRAATEFYTIQLDNRLIKDLSNTMATQKGKKKRDIEEEILKDLRTEKSSDRETKDNDALNFPLARWLSVSVIKRMRLATFPVKVRPQPDDVKMLSLLFLINKTNGIQPPSLEPFQKWTPHANDLIRRQNKVSALPTSAE